MNMIKIFYGESTSAMQNKLDAWTKQEENINIVSSSISAYTNGVYLSVVYNHQPGYLNS